MPNDSAKMPPPTAFDWNKAWMAHRGCLPHLRQDDVVYFVTFRLVDALPDARLDELKAARDRWLAANPPPHSPAQQNQFRCLWTIQLEKLMHAGHGECVLRHPECRAFVETTIRHDDRTRYRLGQFVVMPNHVHVLLQLLPDGDLSMIVKAWKSISARRINKLLKRTGSLWQDEYFDHIVREEATLQRFEEYIRDNPSRLPPRTFTLGCGSLHVD
jgi:REP element-mobilizing transposase RayT